MDQAKSLTPANHNDKFDWELTGKDQGNFDLKMVVFLWFQSEVTARIVKWPSFQSPNRCKVLL